MSRPAKEVTKISKKPGIPRPSAIRQSLGHISKVSVSKALNDVIGHGHSQGNKENKTDPSRAIVTVTLKAAIPDLDTTEFGKVSAKSPLSAVKPTQSKVDSQSSTLNQSPTSARKFHSHSASVPTVSGLRPRESGGGTALPKYRPKGSLLPLKQVTITRKRKNSLIEAVEEEPDINSAPESKKIDNRPISPLPRRSRVQSTVSDSSRMLKPPHLRTPIKQRAGTSSTMSTPSSVRIRTISTNSSRLSAPQKPSTGSPITRIDKRPRLSSESRPNKGASTLATSTSTMTADISSDSIDIADVSALLSVSPNVSPTKSVAPSSVRRVTVRKPPSGPPTPSRKTGVSTLPSRNAAHLSPPSNVTTRKPISRPGGGLTSRKSIMSWADFSNVKLGNEDVNLIAEIAPLQGIVTPGSEDFHPRERVDSGWGNTQENSRIFSIPSSSGPSIGQLMFPTLDSQKLKPEDTLPPDGEAVVAKLLRVKLTETEQEVYDLKAKVKALEWRLGPSSAAEDDSTTVVEFNAAPAADSIVFSELALQKLQNAELEARAVFLEESLAETREVAAMRAAELERSSHVIQRLEEECEEEKRKGDMSIKALMDELPVRINCMVEEVTTERVAAAVTTLESKWTSKLQYMMTAEEGISCWRDVKSIAANDLEAVRQSMATLKVLSAGIEVLNIHRRECPSVDQPDKLKGKTNRF
jgi:hypothetical protein